MAFQRMLVWEIPLLGGEFALVRVLTALPLPFIAGYLAKYLPPHVPEASEKQEAKPHA